MTIPRSNRFDSVASAGASTGASGLVPVVTIRAPASTDIMGPSGPYKLGQEWINSTASTVYILTTLASSNGLVTATWTSVAGGSLSTLTGDTGGAISPVAGNITIAGTANQITSIGTAGTETLSLIGPYTPATYTAHGVLIGEGTSSIVATTAGTAGQVLTSNGAAADPTFQTASGGGFAWAATTTGITLVAGTGSIDTHNAASTILFPLPATATVGQVFGIMEAGINAGARWQITQGASQVVHLVSSSSTVGAAGTVTANERWTSCMLVCTVANNEFTIMDLVGTVTLA